MMTNPSKRELRRKLSIVEAQIRYAPPDKRPPYPEFNRRLRAKLYAQDPDWYVDTLIDIGWEHLRDDFLDEICTEYMNDLIAERDELRAKLKALQP